MAGDFVLPFQRVKSAYGKFHGETRVGRQDQGGRQAVCPPISGELKFQLSTSQKVVPMLLCALENQAAPPGTGIYLLRSAAARVRHWMRQAGCVDVSSASLGIESGKEEPYIK